MREILFRGKVVNGQWVFGCLSILKKDLGRGSGFNAPAGYYISNEAGMPFAFQVRPETVGQYIGQMDKYGRKIFEGDLVKTCPSTITAKEGFPSKVFEVRLGFEMRGFGYRGTNNFYKLVGNIHDKEESK